MARQRVALLLLLGSLPWPLQALQTRALDASVQGSVYRVHFEAVLDAPVERVAAVLSDYLGYVALDPRIRSSELLGTAPDGATLIGTRIRACAAFFCRDVRRVERVTVGPDTLVAEALPALSDVRTSRARTQWRAEGDGTAIRYSAEFVPAFWVPSIVARNYAPRMLRESVLQVFENVERQSRGR